VPTPSWSGNKRLTFHILSSKEKLALHKSQTWLYKKTHKKVKGKNKVYKVKEKIVFSNIFPLLFVRFFFTKIKSFWEDDSHH